MSAISLIAVFAVLWIMQIGGTVWQMRHYRRVLGRISTQWQDGFAGVGNARGRIGKGIILIVVVGTDGIVREALAMRGRTIFAKFRPLAELTGTPLATLRNAPPAARDGGFSKALTQAIAQIDRLRAAGEPPPDAQDTIPALAIAA
jgi:glucitol operon activator protein